MSMRPKRVFANVALVLLLGTALATRASSAPESAEAVFKATLGNGLRVVVVPNALAPVVATDLVYLVGSRNDPPAFPGMAHAQEHMMFRGTKNLSTSQLGTIATALGGDFNASTSETVTQFQFTVPAANLDAVLRIESDRMSDVLDAQNEWQNERGAIEQEVIGDETMPGSEFFSAARALAFANSDYEHDGVGTVAAFNKLTGPDLKAFWEKWYAPNNAVLVIAGNVDPQKTMAEVRDRFDAIPSRAVPAQAKAKLAPVARTVIVKKSRLVYPLAAVGYRMPGVDSPDFLPSYVLQAVLEAPNGPLRELVDSGVALDAEWNSEPYVPEGQFAAASLALPQGVDPAPLAKRLESILADFARHGVSEQTFETTKRRLISDQELSRNSIEALASDWATTIAEDGEPSIAREQQLIADVTLEQVNHTARAYLEPQRAIVGALTPSADATQAVAPQVPQAGPEKQLGTEPSASTLPAWGQALITDVTVPASGLAPVRTKLSNGIDLIVQPETISDSVFVYGAVRTSAALQEPPGQTGVADILSSTFVYGTKTLDRPAFLGALDDLGASLDGGYDFALQSTTATYDRAIGLLAQNELQPRFDEATFENAARHAMEELETSENSSHTLAMQRAAAKLLPAGDPELRQPTLAGMRALTLADVEAYYAQTFRPDLTTIVVVGNVSPDAARASIERAFGAWKAPDTPAPSLELPKVPINPAGDVRITLPSSQQESVTLQQTVALDRSSPAYVPLVVGNAILGGGASGPEQSRLFRELRQNSGLVYSIVSEFGATRTRASFDVEFASLPDNADRIVTAIDAAITKMQTQPVDGAELSLVKASLVRRTIVDGGSVAAIGSQFLGNASSGYPLDQQRLDAQGYVATDADAIKSAFATYIDPDHFVRVLEGP